jgi:hypothetical protein
MQLRQQAFPESLKGMHESGDAGERRSLNVVIFNAKIRGAALAA